MTQNKETPQRLERSLSISFVFDGENMQVNTLHFPDIDPEKPKSNEEAGLEYIARSAEAYAKHGIEEAIANLAAKTNPKEEHANDTDGTEKQD